MGRNLAFVPEMDDETKIPENRFYYNWCCDCGLRHVYYFRIEHDKDGKHVIVLAGDRDDMATDLRKAYIRRRKRGSNPKRRHP